MRKRLVPQIQVIKHQFTLIKQPSRIARTQPVKKTGDRTILHVWLKRCTVLFFVLCAISKTQAFDTVVLDPGHGGHDRGAAVGYVFEKHMALDTARRVEQLLRAKGFKVVMTRSTDVFIPLPGRAAIGNRYGNAIFVSVHYNYSRGGSGHGLETYYCQDKSYQLAGYIQAYMIQDTHMENRGVKHANFHVIKNTTRNPAVLVECGFVSNSSERSGMMNGAYREKIAEGIAKGILAYQKAR